MDSPPNVEVEVRVHHAPRVHVVLAFDPVRVPGRLVVRTIATPRTLAPLGRAASPPRTIRGPPLDLVVDRSVVLHHRTRGRLRQYANESGEHRLVRGLQVYRVRAVHRVVPLLPPQTTKG